MENNKAILILGCFDSKADDFSYLYNCIRDQGEIIITVNTGVMETKVDFPVDVDSDQVALKAGYSITDIRKDQDRGNAVSIMGRGAAKVVAELVAGKRIKAAIGMGGGGGTYIALSAMQVIPFGIPKLVVSTLAGKDISRQMGSKDITLMPSIVDMAGLNSISRLLIMQAAAAISAMSKFTYSKDNIATGSVAISMFGNTSACVDKCSELLRAQGYEVYPFHANGVGGRAMESLIREGCFDAVLDITTTELADDLCGGICSAGPERLNAASDMGIPQVVVPGCLDMVNFAHIDTVPECYRSRDLYSWAPDVTLMRTNEEENELLGRRLAQKVNQSSAAVTILLPRKGISQVDAEGGVFYRPAADKVLFDAIKEHAANTIRVIEVEAHINDKKFARMLVEVLLEMITKSRS